MLSAYISRTLMYRSKFFKKGYKKNEGNAFWNGPIIIIQENYGVMMLAGLLTLEDVSDILL